MPAAIAARGLHRDYGEQPVLRDVSFELEAGRTLVVLGPNGSGKTTLLRILATLLRPGAGRVEVLGATLPVEAWRVRGRIGLLGHEPLLPRELTLGEALRFHARLAGLASARGRIEELLELVRLRPQRDQLVRTLSAGQLQRAAACRCVLGRPELLLLDEPDSHLDPAGAELLAPLIGRGADRTRVLVTHDYEAGLAEADAVLALRVDGTVAYAGPADGIKAPSVRAIYREPAQIG